MMSGLMPCACPGHIGLFLALTGTRIRAADALYCGFGTHYVPHDRLAALTNALADGAAVDAAIATVAADPGEAPLNALRGEIDRCFSGASVEGKSSRCDRMDASADPVARL